MHFRRFPRALLLLVWLAPVTLFAQTFGVYRELWTGLNMPSNDLQYLTNTTYNSLWPNRPNAAYTAVFTTFEAPANTGMNNYGQRMRAFIVPPTSGAYTFWVSSDDSSQLFLSTDETVANKVQLASVKAWTGSRQWNAEPNQQSAPITLQAGRRYYIEAIMQQGSGGDNLAVRWQLPDGSFEEPIPATGTTGTRLVPCTGTITLPGVFQSLTNITLVEGDSAMLTLIATNQCPVSYAWYSNGIALAGAKTPVLVVSNVSLAMSGAKFSCVLSDSVGSITNGPAVLTVLPDTVAPTVVRALNVGMTNVLLTFSKVVDLATATALTNYVFTNGLAVLGASLSANNLTVTLATDPMTFGTDYMIVINGIQDRASIPNTIATNTLVTFTAVAFATQDIGEPLTPSISTSQTNGTDIVASGSDIGGSADQFAFDYQMLVGDFDISVRINAFSANDIWAKAGLIARETLLPSSRYVASLTTPAMSGAFLEYRDPAASTAVSAGGLPVNFPNTWLRLQRVGNTFNSFASYDGQVWTQLGTATIDMASQLYFGMAVSSHDASQVATAQFRELTNRTDTPVLATPVNPHEPPGPCSRKTPIVISEIMYKPAARPDGRNLEFIELYNSNPYFHDISGYRLVGDNLSYEFPGNTILPAGGTFVVAASPADMQTVYGLPNVFGPYTGSLKKSGTLQLIDEAGAILLTVPYSNVNPWPIGAEGTGHSLVMANPTYGEGDPRAWDVSDLAGGSPGATEVFRPNPLRNVLINELLAHSENPAILQYVELYNHSTQTNDLSGCILTDDPLTNRFTIPNGTLIPPGGFAAFDQSQLGFNLKPAGAAIYFLSPDGRQILNAVQYEAQADGVALGRSPDGAEAFYPMSIATPAATNSSILISDIVINEVMYDPIGGNDDDQYIELYNKGTNIVNLSDWRFTSGVSYTFPTNAVLMPDGYLVVGGNLTNLLAKYSNLNATNAVGNFSGRLSHGGERVALAMPQTYHGTNGQGLPSTNTIYVIEDEATYGSGGRWGQWSGGGGSSLELIDPRSNHRLAANWTDSDDTQKSAWTNIEATGVLDNGQNYDSSIDFAQIGLLDAGECLVDNIEVHAGTGGANFVSNPDFENGTANWYFEGCHSRSSLESSGFSSGKSLHLRCSDRIWTGVNSCEVSLNNTSLRSGQIATLRFKARWLHGWPEALLRLGGNWLEATGRLPVPANLGTPGARNSAYAVNAGPAIYDVTHSPAIPAAGQPVVVTARVHDSDGLASVSLLYRIDPAATYTAVTMTDDGTGGDAVAGDGIYSGTIPGFPANTVTPFIITAQDSRAAQSRFPASLNNNAPVRECVVMFGDGNSGGAFGVYHLWITQTNATRWSNLSDLSNEAHDCTIVNGKRVIYNAQARFAGSPYHQGFDTPYGNLCHYKWIFPDDDKFLGATSFNKIHQPGNGAGDDGSQQREQVANSFLRALGVPWLYRRHVVVYVNGNRRGSLMEDAQTPDGDVVDEHYPDDSNGFLFKMQPWFEFAFTPQTGALPSSIPFNNNAWCNLVPYTTTGGALKPARYRYNFEVRRTPDSFNNFTNVFSLVEAAASYGTPNYVANMNGIANMENWMRVFAANHAAGNWDSFGAQNAQNLYGYIGSQGVKYSLHMFDFNISLGNAGSWGPGQELFTVNGQDPNMANIYREPTFRRMYWRALRELCDGPLNVANSGPLIDAKYSVMAGSGLTVENTANLKAWLTSARNNILPQIAAEDTTNFTVNPPQTTNNLTYITGTAPVGIKTITINGVDWPITWTTVTGWQVAIPLQPGTNAFSIVGRDMHGQPVASTSNLTSVAYAGTLPSPAGQLVINEIMNSPSVPDAQYVELYNTSTNTTFDLSGWHFHGLSYDFPPGSSIQPGSFLVLAANRTAFAAAYGAGVPVFDTFSGTLQADGEDLALIQPGASGAADLIVARVRYENVAPWPVDLNGSGKSLQLIDPHQDNWRPGNWSIQQTNAQPAPQWVYVTATGTGSASLLYVYLESIGDIYIDDMKLVAGTVPEAGANLLANGDFESPLSTAWTVSANLSGSALSTAVKHSGNSSLHLVSTSAGSTQGSSIWQTISPSLSSSQTYTLSYWYLQSTNGGPLTVRLSGRGIASSVSPAPPTHSTVLMTPGAINSVLNTLDAFQPLWINELQADNLTGITNVAGQHAGWIEIYNPSTNIVSLNGLYLANNFTNLTNWAFPATAVINPGEFKVVFADGLTNLTTASELHASFLLASGAGQVALSRLDASVQTLDYVNYTNLAANHSYGSFPDGQSFLRQEFFYATPAGTNDAASAPLTVSINEWMASNTKTIANPIGGKYDDWFELYNYGAGTVDLAGYYLTSDLTNKTMNLIPNGYTIPAHGYLMVWADKKKPTGVGDLHVDFKLNKAGTSIGLFAADGTLIDAITFGAQTNDISQGRFPDGGAQLFDLVPTPGSANMAPNSAPVLSPINDAVLTLGQTLAFTAVATDADQPVQTLNFALAPDAPTGAVIDSLTGQFRWTPTVAPLTNTITVVVSDDGSPSMSSTQTFTVTVVATPQLGAMIINGNQITFTWPTASGQSYQILYKDSLDAPTWTPLNSPIAGTGSAAAVNVDLDNAPQRFYRLQLVR